MNSAATTNGNTESMMAQDGSSAIVNSAALLSSDRTSPESTTSSQTLSGQQDQLSEDKSDEQMKLNPDEDIGKSNSPAVVYWVQRLQNLGFKVQSFDNLTRNAKPGYEKQTGKAKNGYPEINFAVYALLYDRSATVKSIRDLLSVWFGKVLKDQSVRRSLTTHKEFYNHNGRWSIATLEQANAVAAKKEAKKEAKKGKEQEKEQEQEKKGEGEGEAGVEREGEGNGEGEIKPHGELTTGTGGHKRKERSSTEDNPDVTEDGPSKPIKRPRTSGTSRQTISHQHANNEEKGHKTVLEATRHSSRSRIMSRKLKDNGQEENTAIPGSSVDHKSKSGKTAADNGNGKVVEAARPSGHLPTELSSNAVKNEKEENTVGIQPVTSSWIEPPIVTSAMDRRPDFSEARRRFLTGTIQDHRTGPPLSGNKKILAKTPVYYRIWNSPHIYLITGVKNMDAPEVAHCFRFLRAAKMDAFRFVRVVMIDGKYQPLEYSSGQTIQFDVESQIFEAAKWVPHDHHSFNTFQQNGRPNTWQPALNKAAKNITEEDIFRGKIADEIWNKMVGVLLPHPNNRKVSNRARQSRGTAKILARSSEVEGKAQLANEKYEEFLAAQRSLLSPPDSTKEEEEDTVMTDAPAETPASSPETLTENSTMENAAGNGEVSTTDEDEPKVDALAHTEASSLDSSTENSTLENAAGNGGNGGVLSTDEDEDEDESMEDILANAEASAIAAQTPD